MKKVLFIITLVLLSFSSMAQIQAMKFLGISLNCTMTTFNSKLKGKGYVQDMNASKENLLVMKGMFAGEKVKVQAHCATKTHLICNVNVCFFMSTRYTYEKLKSELTEKYGDKYVEAHKVEENKGYVPYVTDYCQWFVDQDTLTGKSNTIILSKCDYRSSAPLVISYIDAKNSHIDILEIKSDF